MCNSGAARADFRTGATSYISPDTGTIPEDASNEIMVNDGGSTWDSIADLDFGDFVRSENSILLGIDIRIETTAV